MPNQPFNVVQLALVAMLTLVCISLIVACQSTTDRRNQSMTQLRAMHQGMIIYSNSNKNRFPGLKHNGEIEAGNVEERYQILLDGSFITPEYAISPLENDSSIKPFVPGGQVTKNNYSYAMLQISEGQRMAEWSQTINSHAVVMSDRNTGTEAEPASINGGSPWNGAVLWNDNRVSYELSDTVEAKYGNGMVGPDKLFESTGPDDALLIHTGN